MPIIGQCHPTTLPSTLAQADEADGEDRGEEVGVAAQGQAPAQTTAHSHSLMKKKEKNERKKPHPYPMFCGCEGTKPIAAAVFWF